MMVEIVNKQLEIPNEVIQVIFSQIKSLNFITNIVKYLQSNFHIEGIIPIRLCMYFIHLKNNYLK